MKNAILFIHAAAFGLCVTTTHAWAGAPTEQVRQYTDEVLKVLNDPALKPAERQAAVRKVAIEIFDVSEDSQTCPWPLLASTDPGGAGRVHSALRGLVRNHLHLED